MMETIIQFILNNLDKIIYFVIAITLFIISLCTKKVKIEENPSWMTDLLLYLPDFIQRAEDKFGSGNGAAKLRYVFDLALNKLMNTSGIHDRVSLEKTYGGLIKAQIENILSTPHKKED